MEVAIPLSRSFYLASFPGKSISSLGGRFGYGTTHAVNRMTDHFKVDEFVSNINIISKEIIFLHYCFDALIYLCCYYYFSCKPSNLIRTN